MSGARLVWHQFRFDQKIFWRNPAAVFFTIMLPIIFLFIFATIFGNHTIAARHGLKVKTYYVPGIITLAVSSATLVSLAISLTRSREDGVLKRLRGTPAPAWAIVAGRVGNSIVVSALMVVLLTAIGRIVYGVHLPGATIPAIVVTLLVGASAFSCLGFALTSVIPSEEAAPAFTNAIVLPLYFLSGVFIPETEIPDGVLHVANVFPVRPMFEALLTGFDPTTTGAGFEPGRLAVVAAWGLLGLAIAVRGFAWTPRSERS
ncbi:MAG: type transport system permease protein [Solirubrobacterales bacterium]|jgi:ABC-2 type transport system permease protein|nr:type transport system permease protein [Solirubrobacterales bacterium]MDX6651954.1 type transport system permease protein [Solirubrobacterales bacterium]